MLLIWMHIGCQTRVRRSWAALTGPQIFNIKTFAVKFMSCAAAVGVGLPVGPEGPMIHMGALVSRPHPAPPQRLRPHQQDAQRSCLSSILGDVSVQVERSHTWPTQGNPLGERAAAVAGAQIGSGLSQGASMTLGFSTGLFQRFRNPRDQRDFVTAGDAYPLPSPVMLAEANHQQKRRRGSGSSSEEFVVVLSVGLWHRFCHWCGGGFQCSHWRPLVCFRGGGLIL